MAKVLQRKVIIVTGVGRGVGAGGEAIASGANVASWDRAHKLFAAAMQAFSDVDTALPALRGSFFKFDRSSDILNGEPL